MKKYLVLLLLVILAAFVGSRLSTFNNESRDISLTKPGPTPGFSLTPSNKPCIPTFADGGGPYYRSNAPFRTKIAPPNASGEKIIINGKVLKNDCQTPLAGVVLDIWQADENGNYADEWYRGRITSDAQGNYRFETVIPKGYGGGTNYRPPHIHFKAFLNNREIITSQMFFPDVKGRQGFNDAYIVQLEQKQTNGQIVNEAYHDIVLPL